MASTDYMRLILRLLEIIIWQNNPFLAFTMKETEKKKKKKKKNQDNTEESVGIRLSVTNPQKQLLGISGMKIAIITTTTRRLYLVLVIKKKRTCQCTFYFLSRGLIL